MPKRTLDTRRRTRRTGATRRIPPPQHSPRQAADLIDRSAAAQDRWTRATQLVTRMRTDGLSFSQALHEYRLSRSTTLRLIGTALRRQPNGRYVARPTDRLLRMLVIPASDGYQTVVVRGSRAARLVGEYHNAVQRFLTRGEASGLDRFAALTVTDANGDAVPLVTDRAALTRLGHAGVLSFESIYARVS